MTISTTSNSIIVAGNGAQTAFQFPFVGDSNASIALSTISSTGVVTLIAPTMYSVTLNSPVLNQLWGVGGTVIYPLVGSPVATGTSLLIQRLLPYTQQTSVLNQGNNYPAVTEQALDTLLMQIQQLSARTTQFRGIWATNTNYTFGDIVQDGPNGSNTLNYYICQNANISGTWVTDLAVGDWGLSAIAAVPSGTLTLTGDISGTGSSPITTTLTTVNSNIGTFTNATVTVDGKGRVTAVSNGTTGGTGTVTSVAYRGDGVLQSATPSTAVTTSGTIGATLIAQAANTILAGPSSGANATPTFRALVSADLPSSSFPIFTPLAVGSLVQAQATTGSGAANTTTTGGNLTTVGKGSSGSFTTGTDVLTGVWNAQQAWSTVFSAIWQRTA